MTIEESDNPGGTFQFKDNTAISQNVSINKHKSCLGYRVAIGQEMTKV